MSANQPPTIIFVLDFQCEQHPASEAVVVREGGWRQPSFTGPHTGSKVLILSSVVFNNLDWEHASDLLGGRSLPPPSRRFLVNCNKLMTLLRCCKHELTQARLYLIWFCSVRKAALINSQLSSGKSTTSLRGENVASCLSLHFAFTFHFSLLCSVTRQSDKSGIWKPYRRRASACGGGHEPTPVWTPPQQTPGPVLGGRPSGCEAPVTVSHPLEFSRVPSDQKIEWQTKHCESLQHWSVTNSRSFWQACHTKVKPVSVDISINYFQKVIPYAYSQEHVQERHRWPFKLTAEGKTLSCTQKLRFS